MLIFCHCSKPFQKPIINVQFGLRGLALIPPAKKNNTGYVTYRKTNINKVREAYICWSVAQLQVSPSD